uniref:Uncharacterized protein n=1 Tax=Ditylenchus dipsaci TaxID=166011 RepID=A0A915CPS5_9BILA
MQDECTTFTAAHFGSLNYGLATPAGSPWRPQLDVALEQLQENEELENIRSSWWPTSSCPTEEENHRLGWSDLWCFFLLLPIILLLGLLYFLAKHFMNRKGKRNQANVTNKRGKAPQHSMGRQKASPLITVRNEATSTDEGYDNKNYEHQQQQHVQLHPVGAETQYDEVPNRQRSMKVASEVVLKQAEHPNVKPKLNDLPT